MSLTGQAVSIWSPFDAFEGAATLLRILEEEKAASDATLGRAGDVPAREGFPPHAK
jgi:hypothetical protein